MHGIMMKLTGGVPLRKGWELLATQPMQVDGEVVVRTGNTVTLVDVIGEPCDVRIEYRLCLGKCVERFPNILRQCLCTRTSARTSHAPVGGCSIATTLSLLFTGMFEMFAMELASTPSSPQSPEVIQECNQMAGWPAGRPARK